LQAVEELTPEVEVEVLATTESPALEGLVS
jgi:hypothetical protein